ncbi:hypothetical protein SAMN03159496_02239 [Rhizobium sp. NFR07]|uniref:hypothetical protein n=1 Tax=Rhizobium sp. NFR07 TaxID=1566262 RepID=UPI0008E1ADE1|nr:hypothetical protein [Rhizobium sp. NFR07]SFB18803.1 hypothetical protein SAMN03159496_02239 [Rhizobium sp. NFR07]
MSETINLPQMAPELHAILLAELRRGNRIASVGDWPPTCKLFVILSRPFAEAYTTSPETIYSELNDRHYWKAEYSYRGGFQCLACGF